jgi:DNA segregation ATPase FtsK/SpoIIIE, S-DNA-T family
MSEILPAAPGDIPEEPAAATYQDVTGRGERRPLVADQWQRHNLRATLRQAAGLHWHKTRYHAYRSHIYGARTVFYAGRGAGRLTSRLLRWWHAADLYEVMSTAIASGRGAHGDAMRAHGEIEKTRQRRGRYLLAWTVAVLVVTAVLARFAPWWLWPLPALGLLRLLVHHGKPHGKGVLNTAVVPSGYEKLTSDIVVRALGSLGITAIDKHFRDAGKIAFEPAQRDGPGWRITFDLPYGVTAAEVIEKRDKLAAGLRRPAGCVWPEPEHDDHPGRLTLYVSDQPLSKMRQPQWPLLKAGQADIFQPIPFGTDQRGKPQTMSLIWANLLIGAISRMGKTVALRNVLLAGALDPRAELHVWELKGTGDLSALEKVAHTYGSGADDDTIEACLADLRKVHKELERRAKVIKGLPRELVPDSKVTPQLASRRTLQLYPVLFAVDECQEGFSHPDLKAEFERLTLAIIRRGPALAIMLTLATQRPDAKSLPTAIRANVALRFCLKVMDSDSNNMILGDGSYKHGINATLLAFSDKGVGWAVGFADAAMILKSYNINGPAAARICDRARALRTELGVLSGYAAGDSPDQAEPLDVLGDVLKAMGDGNIHWAMLADRLAAQFPERWEGVTSEAVSSRVRGFGVPSVQVKVDGVNLQGCRRLDVERARA